MNSKPSKNFDLIKPFLRMLEGSIDDARKRRLGDGAPVTPSGYQGRNGSAPTAVPAPSQLVPVKSIVPGNPAPLPAEPDRPLRATPIKPKHTLQPPAGFRPATS